MILISGDEQNGIGIDNEDFYFIIRGEIKSLTEILEGESNNMAKLEGFDKVAVIKYGSSEYHFAIFEDGNKYYPGDTVLLSGNSTPAKIEGILSAEEAAERCKKNITAEVICKLDISAYEKRVEQRKEKERIKKEMEKRKKQLMKEMEDEYYASIDPEYKEMLDQFNAI